MSGAPGNSSLSGSLAELFSNPERIEQWLIALIDERPSADLNLGADFPLEDFVGYLRNNGTPAQVRDLGNVAGALLEKFLARSTQTMRIPAARSRRLQNLLYILECVPAEPSVARRMRELVISSVPGGDSAIGKSLKRQIIRALALAEVDPAESNELFTFFRDQLRDPDYFAAAFSALLRRSLPAAIEQVPVLLENGARFSLPVDQILWGLFRALRWRPEEIPHLAGVMREHPNQLVHLLRTACNEIDVPRLFPEVWNTFQKAIAF